MSTFFIIYIILTSILLSGILFLTYKIVFKNSTDFRLHRFVLLLVVAVSIIMPFNPAKINTRIFQPTHSIATDNNDFETDLTENQAITIATTDVNDDETVTFIETIPWTKIILGVYSFVFMLFLFRLLQNIILLIHWRFTYKTSKWNDFIVVHLPENKATCSFFHWIYINEKGLDENEKRQILTHEKIHASQYHSLDILWIELLSAVMWFNPFIWMIKRELRLVHEYLADDKASGNGTEKVRYQALLLNQVTEGKLIGFSSHFQQSIIKKRIMMIDKQKIKKNVWRKLFWLLPVIVIFAIGTAIVNGQTKSENGNLNQNSSNLQNKESIFNLIKQKNSKSTAQQYFLSGTISDNWNLFEAIKNKKKDKNDMIINYISDVQSVNDILLNQTDFQLYEEDSRNFTELLNKNLSNYRSNTTEHLWAKFYSVKNNAASPIVLQIGYTQKLKNDNKLSNDFNKKVIGKSLTDYFVSSPKTSSLANKSNRDFTVIIDAGHGGKDDGATNQNNRKEKDITLELAKRLQKINSSNHSIKFEFTRSDDEFKTLADRVSLGENADLFVSLHINASKDKNTNGISIYSARNSDYQQKNDAFAKLMSSGFKSISSISTSDTISRAGFYLLKNSKCPAVLLNIGYMTNQKDMDFLNKKENIDLVAEKILDAIKQYRKIL